MTKHLSGSLVPGLGGHRGDVCVNLGASGFLAMEHNMIDAGELKGVARPKGMPFRIGKLGHVVINVRDVARSVRFYTEILGFEVSDIYPDAMVPGGMAFLRCNPDHHGIALVRSLAAAAENVELNHIAFEVATLEEVMRARDHLRQHGVALDFEGRRRAGCQLAVEFR